MILVILYVEDMTLVLFVWDFIFIFLTIFLILYLCFIWFVFQFFVDREK